MVAECAGFGELIFEPLALAVPPETTVRNDELAYPSTKSKHVRGPFSVGFKRSAQDNLGERYLEKEPKPSSYSSYLS